MRTLLFSAVAVAALCASGALKYEPDGYVQEGLVALFDGIRNAGHGKAHDPSAIEWASLAGVRNSMVLHRRDAADTSDWTATGYRFDGLSYGQLVYATPAASNITLEAYGRFVNSEQTRDYPNYISANIGTDFGVFTQKTGNTLSWKTDYYGVGSRPTFSYWGGVNFTCVLDTDAARMYQDATLKVEKSRTPGTTEVIANKWVIATSGNSATMTTGTNLTRQAAGSYNAVRIYSRALTAAEIEQNHALDVIRFKTGVPVTNAVIATSVAGAEGTDPCGAYAVDGSHDFTAPPRVTVGGVTYALAGYTLETWDDGTGDWGAPVTIAKRTCTVAEGEKVRLTWLWNTVAGMLDDASDIGSYASRASLLVHFDGILNTGTDRTHDSATTNWADISTTGNDARLVIVTNETAHAWTANGFTFGGGAHFELGSKQDFGTNFTIQAVTTVTTCGASWPTIFGNSSDYCNIFQSGGPRNVFLKADRITGEKNRASVGGWQGRYLTAMIRDAGTEDAAATLFQGTTPTAFRKGTFAEGKYSQTTGSVRWQIGASDIGTSFSYAMDRVLTGTVHAIRVYDHVMSEDEIVRNRMVDQVRFFGEMPESNIVVVADAPAGFEGLEPAGIYIATNWTFRAGMRTVSSGGRDYVPDGYYLEEWDAAAGGWKAVAVVEDASTWTCPAETPYVTRRLTWRWKVARGLRTVEDYTTGDYVQEGLVLHYDGISNAGADAPHDSNATTWKDLSPSGIDAVYIPNGHTAGGWQDDGYLFASNGSFQTVSAIGFGTNFTVQIAANCLSAFPEAPYYPMFMSNTDRLWQIFVSNRSAKYVSLLADPYNGASWKADDGRPRSIIKNWGGRYITVMEYGGTTAITEGLARDNEVSYPAYISRPSGVAASIWGFGGTPTNSTYTVAERESRQLCGTMKSVRIYARQLETFELERNRKVDEARFFGLLAVTNVVVAAGKHPASVEPAGEYEVEGTWTFRAMDCISGGKRFRILGYEIEAWDGTAWGAPEFREGASYTYVVGTDPAKVRLTWKWQGPGTTLLFR
jgi:hypothetical protein